MVLKRALEIRDELKVLAKEDEEITIRKDSLNNLKNKLNSELEQLSTSYVFKFDYEYFVKFRILEGKISISSSLKKGDEVIKIERVMKNYNKYKVYYDLFNLKNFCERERVEESVMYYRRFGVLLKGNGGGILLLEDEIQCNDEEWKELLKGNINKFLKKQ